MKLAHQYFNGIKLELCFYTFRDYGDVVSDVRGLLLFCSSIHY